VILRGLALVAVLCLAIDIIRRTFGSLEAVDSWAFIGEGALLGGLIGALVGPDLGGAIFFGLVGLAVGAFFAYRVVFNEWFLRGGRRTKGK
jgi:hypothetical protein